MGAPAGPWFGRDRERLRFELDARRRFARLESRTVTHGSRRGRLYRIMVDVPNCERRRLTIVFPTATPRIAKAFADGPGESPHRYADGSLCIWDPRDPSSRRWVFADGLSDLIGLAIAHLFREAWWRETGEWPGEEAEHG